MKQEHQTVYTLLKDLPNVSVGQLIKLSKKGTCYTCVDKQGGEATFSRKLIENNPEWFKKEEPKPEWEILAYRHRVRKTFWRKEIWGGGEEWDRINPKNDPVDIWQVKRLSDNEVFTVGDKLMGLGMSGDDIDEIKSILLVNGTIAFDYGFTGGIIISYAKKYVPKQEPEPIKVNLFQKDYAYNDGNPISYLYRCYVSSPIPKEKYPAIKQAIENCLNGVLSGVDLTDVINRKEKLFTEKELLDAEEKVWNDCRTYIPYVDGNNHKIKFKYEGTFSDYKNSQNHEQ